jgi:acyl-CoA thioesterase
LDKQLKQAGIEIITENFLAEQSNEINANYQTNITCNESQEQQIAAFIGHHDQIAKMMNIQIESVDKGACQLSMKVTPQHLNAAGVLHGAATFALADVAFAIASNTHNRVALSIDSNIKFLAACKVGDSLIASAKEISLGKTIAHYQIEIIRLSDNKLSALFTGSVFRKEEKLIDN